MPLSAAVIEPVAVPAVPVHVEIVGHETVPAGTVTALSRVYFAPLDDDRTVPAGTVRDDVA